MIGMVGQYIVHAQYESQQTIFDLCIPIKELAKTRSKI